MKCVIMAGGKGTRLHDILHNIPKPMVDVCGKPVLEHEIDCLKEQGITEYIITVSHRADAIMDYFGDGTRFGVKIEYYKEDQPLGNAGALFRIREKLTEDFLLINGDMLFQIDVERFTARHKECDAWITLLTHPNHHPYDSVLIETDKCGLVSRWITKEDYRNYYYKNRTNAGLHIMSPKSLGVFPETDQVDLDRQIIRPLIGKRKVVAYDSSEYVKDIGTPERLEQARQDYEKGVIAAKYLKRKQRAVFLDRDGVINRYVGFLTDISDFELIPGAAEAISLLNRAGLLVVVVTNQPVIARGDITIEQLEMIHCKMETLLGEMGAYVDGIYFCPHHPDAGFKGEIKELKTDCDCRKPKPGMLLRAAEDYNIDLSKSWMIGDEKRDIEAGNAAGTSTILLSGQKKEFGQKYTFASIQEAIQLILNS